MDYVGGYVIFNDITARDIQRREMESGVFSFCKAIDTFCPLGPWIVTPDEIPDPHDLAMELRVNGEVAADVALGAHVRDDPGDPLPLLGARLLGGGRPLDRDGERRRRLQRGRRVALPQARRRDRGRDRADRRAAEPGDLVAGGARRAGARRACGGSRGDRARPDRRCDGKDGAKYAELFPKRRLGVLRGGLIRSSSTARAWWLPDTCSYLRSGGMNLLVDTGIGPAGSGSGTRTARRACRPDWPRRALLPRPSTSSSSRTSTSTTSVGTPTATGVPSSRNARYVTASRRALLRAGERQTARRAAIEPVPLRGDRR